MIIFYLFAILIFWFLFIRSRKINLCDIHSRSSIIIPFLKLSLFIYQQTKNQQEKILTKRHYLFSSERVANDLKYLYPADTAKHRETLFYVHKLSLFLLGLFVGCILGILYSCSGLMAKNSFENSLNEAVSTGNTYSIYLLVVMIILFFMENVRLHEKVKKRNRDLLLAYPDFVGKMTLLLGSGLSVRQAWEKVIKNYQKHSNKGSQNELMEQLVLTYHEMKGGVSEIVAYVNFGKRCNLRCYQHFSALLSQNIRRGGECLTKLLRDESDKAYEERKRNARKTGEEAGTKMLFPMAIMLVIVIIIIMVPAIWSFQ